MDSFDNDLALMLAYVEKAKSMGRFDCVYNTNKISGTVYKFLAALKEKLPGHKIWYVDPVLARAPHQVVEEWGIHIQWALPDE
jgi:hypothetical protein